MNDPNTAGAAGQQQAAAPPAQDDDERQSLPVYFFTDDGKRIKDPVYQLTADGFYGDTHWIEGEVIVTEITPNHYMVPLNQAAEQRQSAWLNSLPAASGNLHSEDLQEAAIMIQHQLDREGVKASHVQFFDAVTKLARGLREKREKHGRYLPNVGVRAVNRGPVAPMGNVLMEQPQHAGMGMGSGPVQRAAMDRSERVARRTKPAVGNLPASSDPGQG